MTNETTAGTPDRKKVFFAWLDRLAEAMDADETEQLIALVRQQEKRIQELEKRLTALE